MTQTRWNRRDGSGTLSARRQKEYERAGISEQQYKEGYRLTYVVMPPRGRNDVREWSRETLETTVVLQWGVIHTLEGKLENGKA